MGSNSINLAFRFLLELAALSTFAFWGWNQAEGLLRYILALGIPVLAAAAWGTFAVLDDPSRSGKAPVPVPGIIRLLLELVFFAFAIWTLFDLGNPSLAWGLGLAVGLHYLISYDRLAWLLKQ